MMPCYGSCRMRRQCLSCVLVLLVFLACVQSQAPGDGDPFCTQLSEAVTPPAYPSNSRILMDSFHYLQLLSPVSNIPSAWQQVDVDDIISSTAASTEWIQLTSTPCRQNLFSCYFRTPVQENWLITQFIDRNPNDTLLPQVNVLVEYQLSGCNATCQVFFDVNIWETSGVNAVAARDTANYRRVRGVTPSMDATRMAVNESIEVTFQSSTATGFYLALVDMNTCIAVTRVLVFYHVCPKLSMDLILYPETIAPRAGLKTVTTQCAEGAKGELNPNITLSCLPKGIWAEVLSGTGCRCKSGFLQPDGLEECRNCMANEYVSPTNFSCLPCPSNTMLFNEGVAICQCEPGYFRAPGETADFGCTRPPGQPTDVMVVERTRTSITFSWKAPEDNGGRTDLEYGLYYQPQGENTPILGNTVNTTIGTISGLDPNRRYQFFVVAENGVSEQSGNDPEFTQVLDEFSSNNSTLIIVIVVVLIVIVMIAVVVVAAFIMYLQVQRRRSANLKASSPLESHAVVPIAIKGRRTYVDPLTYASVNDAIEEFAKEIEPKHLKLTTELGAGEFGTVYRAVWKEQGKKQVEVAVKTLKPGSSTKARGDFLNEASIMGQFQHDHVIKLYGVITKVDPAMIIMEFMENGSLFSYLRKNDEKLNSTRLLKMARGVCSGMEYLSTVGYVHRDLAARNVLLDKDEICKVADFGLSREVVDDEYNVQKGGKIPVRWTAPEAIYRRKFTSSSDVWSFGVLLWEVMSYAQHPYDEWDNQQVLDQLDAGYRLSAPYGCPGAVHEVMLDCWHRELSQRPTFGEVLKRLDLLLHTESPPKRPPKKNRNSGNPSASNPLQFDTVEEWLVSVKMERYIPKFQEHGINTVNQLVHMTENDLRDMGITLAGHLHKLTSSIESGYVEMKRNSTFHT